MPRLLLTLLAAAVAMMLAPAAGLASLARTDGPPAVSVITTGLNVPWDIAFLPDGRALVTERPGTVRLVSPTGKLQAAPVATLDVSQNGEGGLLGIALDPAFTAGSPFVYLTATIGTEMQVQRWRWTGSGMTFDGIVVRGITMGTIHSSGRVRFGPDGAMYVGAGDAGNGANSQNMAVRNGKILRVGPGQYRGGLVAPEIHATGVRNPQGFAWQPGSGRFYSTEHGPSGFDGPSGDDELDLVVPGGNYGWPLYRGGDVHPAGYTAPVHLWSTTIAPSGIEFVSLPGSSWTGRAIVAGLKGQVLRLLTFEGAAVVADEPLLKNAFGRLRAVAEAPDGAIWITTSNRDGRGAPVAADDRILRIVPPAAGAPPAPPALDDPSAPAGPGTVTPRTRPGAGILTLTAPRAVTAGATARVVVIFDRTPAGPVALQTRRAGRWRTVRLARPRTPVVRFAFRPARAGVHVMRVRHRAGGRGVDRPLRLTVRR